MRTDPFEPVTESFLDVPGARLRYLVRGSGPVLVLVAGGHGDASRTDALAGLLADRYTVLTYDRRGLSGSLTSAPATTLTTHAEDLSRLLHTVASEPAYVFGTSIGALIALELTARHPGQVAAVVAHEPGGVAMLPEPERAEAVRGLLEVEETFRAEGAAAALGRFAASIDIDPTDRETDVAVSVPGPQQLANAAYLFTHDLPALRAHTIDLASLRESGTRLLTGVGEWSAHTWPNRCGRLLADALDVPCETFPGGHNGYVFRPRGTAETLRGVLDAYAPAC